MHRTESSEYDHDVCRGDRRVGRVRYRQDVFLAHHARCCERPVSSDRCRGHEYHWRDRHDVGRSHGTPGLGYAKDRFSGAALREADPELYAEYKADTPSKFLFFAEVTGLDGKKLGDVQLLLEDAREQLQASGDRDPQRALLSLTDNERTLYESSIAGDRMTLVADSFIPGTMAFIYLALLLYFRAIGGYRPIHIAAELTGGVQGPMEA